MVDTKATILIVDDSKLNRKTIKVRLQGYGYHFLEAEDGQKALEQLQSHRVDLVILDLVMPRLDGFGLLAKLHEHPLQANIPVIVYSCLEDLDSIQKALALGSYDYFSKSLPEKEAKILLPLKVKNAVHTKLLLDEVSEKKAILEQELEAASRYQRFLLPKNFVVTGMEVESFFHPYINIGGDFFDFVPLTAEKTAFILADVSGHGVLSAMVATILKPLFGQYIRETESPRCTLQRLNRDFFHLTTDGYYVTAFVAVYNPLHHTLCYANAGHPPPLYITAGTHSSVILPATGTILGMFAPEEFEITEQSLPIAPHDRLFLVTDGILEATSPQRILFGIDGLQKLSHHMMTLDLKSAKDYLWWYLQDFTGGHFTDDVTFIAIDFQEDQRVSSKTILLSNDPSAVFPTVEQILHTLETACTPLEQKAIQMSLVEILMNAIEHGNLVIGYEQKGEALAAGTLDRLIEERRRSEPFASRRVTVTYSIDATKATFTIRDEGKGFDWRTLPDARNSENAGKAHGRGLLIARANMDEVTFNQQGNEVRLVKYFAEKEKNHERFEQGTP